MAIPAGLHEHFAVARYTSWHVGGTVCALFKPRNLDDLCQVLASRPADEQRIWLGLGSNVLMPDEELDALVIYPHQALNTLEIDEQEQTITAMAGVTCAKLAKAAAKLGDERAAFWIGIPGTVGGAVCMNAGCYGAETWEFIKSLTVVDRQGQLHELQRDDVQAAYRHTDLDPDLGIVQACFHYQPGPAEPALKAVKTLLQQRMEQQPIGVFSCGSVFRNPPGDYAARLIDSCGLKGLRHGDAEISPKHANFIINLGQAKASDIRYLMDKAQDTVREQCGIMLQPEVRVF